MTERITANNLCSSPGMSNTRNILAVICFTGSDHLHHWKLIRAVKNIFCDAKHSFRQKTVKATSLGPFWVGLIPVLEIGSCKPELCQPALFTSLKELSKVTAMSLVKETFWNWNRQCPDAKNPDVSVKSPVLILWNLVSLPFTYVLDLTFCVL